jgi:hypothetical protein
MRNSVEYVIYNAITPQTATSSTDATPIVVTKTAHGYATGDLIVIQGHTTNVAANGIFKITRVDADSFSLQNPYTGANVAGSGAGAGSNGIMCAAPKIPLVEDFRHVELEVVSAGTATFTFKVAGSMGRLKANIPAGYGGSDVPDFGATQSKTNPYSFIQIIDLVTNTAVDGSTGIVTAGTDIVKAYEVNTNGLKWLTILPSAWTQGNITVKLKAFNDI